MTPGRGVDASRGGAELRQQLGLQATSPGGATISCIHTSSRSRTAQVRHLLGNEPHAPWCQGGRRAHRLVRPPPRLGPTAQASRHGGQAGAGRGSPWWQQYAGRVACAASGCGGEITWGRMTGGAKATASQQRRNPTTPPWRRAPHPLTTRQGGTHLAHGHLQRLLNTLLQSVTKRVGSYVVTMW